MTDKELNNWKQIIDKMSHYQMIKKWQNKILVHPIFQNEELCTYFKDRLDKLGGENLTQEENSFIQNRVTQLIKTGTYN